MFLFYRNRALRFDKNIKEASMTAQYMGAQGPFAISYNILDLRPYLQGPLDAGIPERTGTVPFPLRCSPSPRLSSGAVI
jgi:hypothetical protein